MCCVLLLLDAQRRTARYTERVQQPKLPGYSQHHIVLNHLEGWIKYALECNSYMARYCEAAACIRECGNKESSESSWGRALGSTSGLIRSSTFTGVSVLFAAAMMLSRSNSESTLIRTPCLAASSSSQGSLPLPLSTVLHTHTNVLREETQHCTSDSHATKQFESRDDRGRT